jgi:hypothetical protein
MNAEADIWQYLHRYFLFISRLWTEGFTPPISLPKTAIIVMFQADKSLPLLDLYDYKLLVGKSETKTQLGRLWRRW